jgi:hypothetical protein
MFACGPFEDTFDKSRLLYCWQISGGLARGFSDTDGDGGGSDAWPINVLDDLRQQRDREPVKAHGQDVSRDD